MRWCPQTIIRLLVTIGNGGRDSGSADDVGSMPSTITIIPTMTTKTTVFIMVLVMETVVLMQ